MNCQMISAALSLLAKTQPTRLHWLRTDKAALTFQHRGHRQINPENLINPFRSELNQAHHVFECLSPLCYSIAITND